MPVARFARLGRHAAGAAYRLDDGSRNYFSAVETLVKVAFSDDPRLDTTVMMATEMPAAISPYSMAVAPDSLARNLQTVFMTQPCFAECSVPHLDSEHCIPLNRARQIALIALKATGRLQAAVKSGPCLEQKTPSEHRESAEGAS